MFTKIVSLPKEGDKTALLIRLGAWGDMVWASAVVREMKKEGYNVTLNCTDRGYTIVKNDPNIDRFVVVDDGELSFDELSQRFWPALSKGFNKVVNLTGSLEDSLLVTPNTADPLTGEVMYNWDHQRRHTRCNVNYMDRTMEIAGYPDCKGVNGQLFFTEKEENWAKAFKAKLPGFLIVWSLGGSAAHKAYPYAELVAQEILKTYEDVQVVTVGDNVCKLLEFGDHPRNLRKCGEFGIRKSLVLAKHADLVIGPESSVINAASCYDVPKILMLSHGSVENLSKYWTNTINLSANVPCYPCHKLHYTLDCPLVEQIKSPVCMGKLNPNRLLEAIEQVYGNWKAKQLLGVK